MNWSLTCGRTSGEILKKQVLKWPDSVLRGVDLVFPDGPFPAQGKSNVKGIFDRPYFEWFQFNKVSVLCRLYFESYESSSSGLFKLVN
ncbi:hypothetical protein NL676_013912 [Syzygium grande]|nr:hypothetical protein NL676_013912 [Syzygium grande]